jgi:hypothetical protein
MRSLRPLAASGLSQLPDNPTLLPDERDGPSSGLSRTSSGQQLEPDDDKYLTDAGYSGFVGFVGFCRGMGATNRK